jgi:hypothetical protein
LLSSAFSISAQERWFEVELLLFKRTVDLKDVKEDLTINKNIVDSRDTLPLLKTAINGLCVQSSPCFNKKIPLLINDAQFDSQGNGFQLLDNSQLQLSQQREKLIKHAAFQPLLHLAWRMPVKSENSAKAIHLVAGENYGKEMNSEYADKWTIDGNFKIYLDHYLFIDSQLLIRQQTTQEIIPAIIPSQDQDFEIFSTEDEVQIIEQKAITEPAELQQKTVIADILFDQNRRLRSGEIHYFDHPLMGMLVQIRKIND